MKMYHIFVKKKKKKKEEEEEKQLQKKSGTKSHNGYFLVCWQQFDILSKK